MKNIIKNNILFVGILAAYIFLSISMVGYYDYSGDSSIYSVRAFGWTDYIGDGQKGPVEWLGQGAWWSNLSFQDAPPVVFGLQFIFFRIFGDGINSVQFLYFTFGVMLLCSIYYFVNKIWDLEIALWSTGSFAVSSLALWSTLSGNLEGVETLFIILNFLYFALFIKTKNNKYFYLSIFLMGLALMSKYTAIFTVPSFLISLYVYNRKKNHDFVKNNIKYVCGFIIFILTLSPTIIYNFYLYKFRGNFDTALSAMLGIQNELGRGVNFNFVFNSFDVLSTLFKTVSLPYLSLCLIGFVYLIVKSQRNKTDVYEDSILVYTSLYFIMLGFMGGGVRWLPILAPFFSIIIGLFIKEIRSRYGGKTILSLILAILFFELFYSVNTNYLSKPISRVGVFSSVVRNKSDGFNELEIYLNNELQPFTSRYRASKSEELKVTLQSILESSNKIIMYDGRVNWFAKKWYLEKYFIYYKIGVFSYENSVIRNSVIPKNTTENSGLVGSNKTLYFIEAVSPDVMNIDNSNVLVDRMMDFINNLKKTNVPFVEIINKQGMVAFKVYKIQF